MRSTSYHAHLEYQLRGLLLAFYAPLRHTSLTHLKQEYLAVLETNHRTPYYLNLHCKDTAHSVILGRTGSGKCFLAQLSHHKSSEIRSLHLHFRPGRKFRESDAPLRGNLRQGGHRSNTDFKINPFCLAEDANRTSTFWHCSSGPRRPLMLARGLSIEERARALPANRESLQRRSRTCGRSGCWQTPFPRSLALKLQKWTPGGQFGFLFDNAEDTVSFSKFQCFDFQGMEQYPEILEPLLFYILHRANHIMRDREITHIFKAFFIDEAWTFLRNPRIKGYIVEALKTWRKQNAAMILSTQSLDELRKSDIVDVIIETCATKIFLANPDMDRDSTRISFISMRRKSSSSHSRSETAVPDQEP